MASRLQRDVTAVGLLALGARLLAIGLTPGYLPRHDDRSYVLHALSLLLTGHYPWFHLSRHVLTATAYRPPGWPAALAALWSVTGAGLGSARLLLAVIGAFTAVLVLLVGRRLFGKQAGLAAGVLAALCPPLIAVGASLESETLFNLLLVGAVLAALLARGGSRPMAWAVLAGVLTGAAALTRTNGLVLIPVLALLAARAPLRHPLAPVAALLAACCVVLPWTLRNEHALHAFVPVSTETGNTLAGTYNGLSARLGGRWVDPRPHHVDRAAFRPGENEAALDAALTSAAERYAEQHPLYPPRVLLDNSVRYSGLSGPGWVRFSLGTMSLHSRRAGPIVWLGLLITTALGLLGIAPARRRGVPAAFWLVPVLLWLSGALVNGELRLAAPALPFLCLLGGVALEAAGSRARARSRWLRPAEPGPHFTG